MATSIITQEKETSTRRNEILNILAKKGYKIISVMVLTEYVKKYNEETAAATRHIELFIEDGIEYLVARWEKGSCGYSYFIEDKTNNQFFTLVIR